MKLVCMMCLIFAVLLYASTEEVVTVSSGQRIRLSQYLEEGKLTIFLFTSPGCLPCQRVSLMSQAFVRDNDRHKLVHVDINRPHISTIDFSSPVARQFNIRGLPSLKIYDSTGEQVSTSRFMKIYENIRKYRQKAKSVKEKLPKMDAEEVETQKDLPD